MQAVDFKDFSDFDTPVEFSQEFIDYTNQVADRIEQNAELSEKELWNLAKALGSYQD